MIRRDPSIEADATERLADARLEGEEEELDRSLRPRRLADFINQEQVTDQLGVFIEAARRRGEPLDHVLLAGPPGLGKTSLAHIIAAELEAELVTTAGPALERKADVRFAGAPHVSTSARWESTIEGGFAAMLRGLREKCIAEAAVEPLAA